MSIGKLEKTKLDGFKWDDDICSACRMDLESDGWVFLCEWCQGNLQKIYHLEIIELEVDSGEVYSV